MGEAFCVLGHVTVKYAEAIKRSDFERRDLIRSHSRDAIAIIHDKP
jgi:hypothetical protein